MRSSTTRSADEQLRAQERAENFPVALRLLPAAYRRDLRAVYDVVRVIDDLGDDAAGDRPALLRAFAADVDLLWAGGEPRHRVLRRLQPSIAARGLSKEAFDRLIEANQMDQTVSGYDRLDDLLHYCSLSASPIGLLVLEVFGQSSAGRRALSDRVCMALQLLEHWQDVAEDHRNGRIYLPQEDLARFGVTSADLGSTVTSPELRSLIRYETARASELLESGAPLVADLHGWARLAVAGYVAGGRATVEALLRADGDVMPGPPRPRRRAQLRHLLCALWGSRR